MARKKKTPKQLLWRLEDGITFSALNKWMECPEQFSMQWLHGLTPKKISIPLEFGSLFHSALEYQFEGNPRDIASQVSDKYKQARLLTLKNSHERDTLEYVIGLMRITFPLYCQYWENDDKKIEWVKREQKFAVEHTLNVDGEDRTILLRGMIDGLYRLPGTLGIFETKTKDKISEKDIETALYSDMQTMMYCFATKLLLGEYPNQVKYNIVRRTSKYWKKGLSLPEYLAEVEEDIKSRPDFYFIRFTVGIDQNDIDEFVARTLNPVLRLFIRWWDSVKKNPEERFNSPYHYLNSSALVGKYGKAAMWDAIFGNTEPYYVRTSVFPELEESIETT